MQQAEQQELTKQRDRTEGYLRVDPNNKQLLTRAVELNLSLGNANGAQSHALSALALFPDDALIQCLHAHVLFAQHRWSEAAAIYQTLLSSNSDADLAFSLANCQSMEGQHQVALDTMAPFEALPDLPAETITLLVRACHHVGKLERAIDLIAQHHTRLAQSPAFLAAASLVYFDADNAVEAERFSHAALALGERPVEALVANASLALARIDGDQAYALFDEAIAINPTDGRSWAGIGLASMAKKDFAGAATQLAHAVTLTPGNVGIWNSLGWSHLLIQALDEADRAFSSALALDRNVAETHGSLAAVAALRGERATAEATIQRAMRLDSACLSAQIAQAILNGDVADRERFIAMALQMVEGGNYALGTDLKQLLKSKLVEEGMA